MLIESTTPPQSKKLSNLSLLVALKGSLGTVGDEIAELTKLIPTYLPVETDSSQRMVQHLFSNPGKMIRPALYLLSCRLFSYEGPHKFSMAAVCEFVHTASLLHDDVIDNSTTRRNRPTANSIWGDEAAVLMGDLIYARASEMMAETSNLQIVSAFAQAIRIMSESELLQLEHLYSPNIPADVYFRILNGKTAVLIGAACKCAGLLGGANTQQLHAIESFGQKIGTAFQVVDDALDFLGETSILGKTKYLDLQEGKVTLPVILLKTFMTVHEKKDLEAIYKEAQFTGSEINKVAALVHKYNTAHMALTHARQMTDEASDILHTNFPPSSARDDLESLAHHLSFRMH
ncbi:MAG: polyprenyl synthetase family protein [Deltaproteobacteria bacterium]|nr:polyprenyl synthetase family protein [Deltaproteobacteria bacterium]